jgi:hypothetical protein
MRVLRREGVVLVVDETQFVSYEARLWQIADALRGSMDVAEYKHAGQGLKERRVMEAPSRERATAGYRTTATSRPAPLGDHQGQRKEAERLIAAESRC